VKKNEKYEGDEKTKYDSKESAWGYVEIEETEKNVSILGLKQQPFQLHKSYSIH
jgi:hypothetical protein